ncbi:hypothetical protein BDF19DRAFT_185525 [Syncephalis fuscata]|nr:hypothetical protein BDF19DRAFT_185525 [Syncephalis fuscata]
MYVSVKQAWIRPTKIAIVISVWSSNDGLQYLHRKWQGILLIRINAQNLKHLKKASVTSLAGGVGLNKSLPYSYWILFFAVAGNLAHFIGFFKYRFNAALFKVIIDNDLLSKYKSRIIYKQIGQHDGRDFNEYLFQVAIVYVTTVWCNWDISV